MLNPSDLIDNEDRFNEIKIVEYLSLLQKQIRYTIKNGTHVESRQRITSKHLETVSWQGKTIISLQNYKIMSSRYLT